MEPLGSVRSNLTGVPMRRGDLDTQGEAMGMLHRREAVWGRRGEEAAVSHGGGPGRNQTCRRLDLRLLTSRTMRK